MERPKARFRLAHSGLLLSLSRVLGAGLAFATSVVVARGLGPAGFGEWTVAMAWAVALAMLSDFSLNTLLAREAARTPQSANRLLLGAMLGKLPFLLVMTVLIVPLAPRLAVGHGGEAALRLALALAAANLAYGSFTAVFRAVDRVLPVLWLDTLGLLGQLLGAYWLLQQGAASHTLVGMAAMVQGAVLLTAGALWRLGPGIRGGPARVALAEVRQMIRHATPFALAAALGAVQVRSSVLVLGYLGGAAAAGAFGAAWRLADLARLVPNGLFAAAFPALASAAPADETAARFRRLVLGLLAYGCVAGTTLAALARPLLAVTYGAGFVTAEAALTWLALGLAPGLLVSSLQLKLYATGDEHYAVRIDAAMTGIQVALSLLLVGPWAAAGAALAIGLSRLAVLPWLWARVRARLRARAQALASGSPGAIAARQPAQTAPGTG